MPFVIWTSSYVFEVYEDKIIKKKLFGLFGVDLFDMRNLQACRTRVDSNGRLTRLVLLYNDGRLVQFHKFQPKFLDVLKFFHSNYSQIMDNADEDGPWSL